MQIMSVSKARLGFSLIELLVVIAILGVLIALTLPSMRQARERAEQVKDMSNIRSGSFVVLTYFNDFKNFIPPLAGTWGYNYGSWYSRLRPYTQLGNPNGNGTAASDRPFALMCQSKVRGVEANGYSNLLYGVNWRLRYRVGGNPNTSYKTDELINLDKTGLFFCSGYIGDAIYYMAIPYYGLNQRFNTGNGNLNLTPQHNGTGTTNSYLDGHGDFSPIRIALHDQYSIAEAQVENWDTSIPWTHRSFWGRTNGVITDTGTTWVSNYYKFND
jgi:prepilin-type N-terminal cleavage/methylation domain-containing protein